MRDSARNRSLRFGRSSSPRPLALVGLLIVVALLLVLLDYAGSLAPVRTQAVSLLSPALAAVSGLGQGLGGLGQGLGESQQLRDEVAQLRKRIGELEAERIKSEAALLENAQLRKELKIEQDRPWQLLGATVAARSPDAGRHTLLLTVGSEQGVAPGMAVIGQEGTSPPALIGVVESVQPRSASVLLITDYGSTISARIFHSGDVSDGVIQGQWQRGAWLRLDQIDRSVKLNPGNTVTTAGLTGQLGLDLPRSAIPQDVPIGTIAAVRQEGHTQSADVLPYVDPSQVRYAWVILGVDG
ncbi:MAG: rod shape-determining protein MreC [Roseiflexaceae bacterium]